MEIIDVKSDKPYKIYFEENILKNSFSIFEENFLKQKRAGEVFNIVTDKNVSKLYLKVLLKQLRRKGFNIRSTVLPVGEKIKDIKYYHLLMRDFVKHNLSRDSVVIALGGGVIGDLAGFSASTYMRGCNFVQIPTTLLAQVDSSIGGKVGINLKEGKNLVGSFYSPKFVLVDPSVLETLKPIEFVAGFAEIIKSALIYNKNLFNIIYNKILSLKDEEEEKIESSYLKSKVLEDEEFMSKIILGAIRIKREIVQSDEFETNIRMILNFGHTFGHAIEKITGYKKFLHGEAVLLGMKIAAELSVVKGYLSKSEHNKIINLLNVFELPKSKAISAKNILKQISSDKKRRFGKLNYILLKKIGDGYPDDSVDDDDVLKAIKSYI